MSNDERVGRLLQAIENLAETSGQKEATKVIPNCRVVDADPSDIPGYIIVENELGYYVPAVKSPDITYQDDDVVNLLIIKGTEPIAFQHGTGSGTGGYPGALPLTTKGDIVTRDASDNIRLGVGDNGLGLIADSSEAEGLRYGLPGIRVKNTSGATVNVGDVGYIDYLGEFKTTTTAENIVDWAVVDIGGANNAVISVIKRGRTLINYTGSAPTSGQYLTTSTVAGSALAQAYVSPAIMGVIPPGVTAAGGQVEALLLCGRKSYPVLSSENLLSLASISSSDFVATINGSPSGANLTYNAPSSGAEDTVVPQATTELAKIVLWNTSKSPAQRAYIIATNTGTNVITVSNSANIATWANGETITTRSQTNTDAIVSTYFYDLDVTNLTDIPPLTTALILAVNNWRDTGAANMFIRFHPYTTGAASKRISVINQVANISYAQTGILLELINRRLCLQWGPSGAGTGTLVIRVNGVEVATP